MGRIIDTRSIGTYTLSIYDDGAITIQSVHHPDPVAFDATQAQELLQWLSQQKERLPLEASNTPVIAPAESSEEIAQRVINDAIALTREHHPASLELENRDRFIDQITRDPDIKPLVAQGKISRKQIMLWMEQQLGGSSGSAPSLWTQDKKRRR